jgi:TPR repeat protein
MNTKSPAIVSMVIVAAGGLYWWRLSSDHATTKPKLDEAQFRRVCDVEHVFDSLPTARYAEEWQKMLDACAVAARPMADAGNSAAQAFLGVQLERDEKYESAVPWLEKAANQGQTEAMNRLGYIYSSTELHRENKFKWNPLVDGKKALDWYRRSAALGNPQAMLQLGNVYLDGVLVTADYRRAIQWYEKAVEAGEDREGAATLMGIYSSNRLGAVDEIQAYKWASIDCADFGRKNGARNDVSCGLRDELEGQMKPDEISKAQQLASEWEDRFRRH